MVRHGARHPRQTTARDGWPFGALSWRRSLGVVSARPIAEPKFELLRLKLVSGLRLLASELLSADSDPKSITLKLVTRRMRSDEVLIETLVRYGVPGVSLGLIVFAVFALFATVESSEHPAENARTQQRYEFQHPSTRATPGAAQAAVVSKPLFARIQAPVSAKRIDQTQQISVLNGKLSVRLASSPLGLTLAEIGKQSGIQVNVAPEIASVLISGELQAVPLVQGLATLLRGVDTHFLFRGEENTSSVLKAIWVSPSGKDPMLARTQAGTNPGTVVANTTSGQAGTISGSVVANTTSGRDFKSKAAENTSQSNIQVVTAEVTQELQDRDPRVRYRALATGSEHQLMLPVYALQQMASTDTDAAVRLLAMNLFAQHAEANPSIVRATAEVALKDGDVSVQAQAKDILDQLSAAARSNEELDQLSVAGRSNEKAPHAPQE